MKLILTIHYYSVYNIGKTTLNIKKKNSLNESAGLLYGPYTIIITNDGVSQIKLSKSVEFSILLFRSLMIL